MSFWFTLPKQANLGCSQPSPADDNTTSFADSLPLLMSPWVTALVSELCGTPRPAVPPQLLSPPRWVMVWRTGCDSGLTQDTFSPSFAYLRTPVPQLTSQWSSGQCHHGKMNCASSGAFWVPLLFTLGNWPFSSPGVRLTYGFFAEL